MTTRLDKTLKREIDLDGQTYTLILSPDGLKVVEKGRRKGTELSWRSIISGEASLMDDLRISVDATAPE